MRSSIQGRSLPLSAIMILSAMLEAVAGHASGQAIAYDTNSTALVAAADFSQSVAACGVGCGNCPPSSTVNGLVEPWSLGGDLLNCWAVAPYQNQDHIILWSFTQGTLLVNAIQIINVYPYASTVGPHFIGHFSLDYTVDPSPSLNSVFQPLTIVDLQGASGVVSGNAVTTTGGADLRVLFTPTAATAIRLHSFPNAGISINGNFVISEVSFDTYPGPRELGRACSALYLTWSGAPFRGANYTVTTQNLGLDTQLLLVDWSNLPGKVPPLRFGRACQVYLDPDYVLALGTTPSHTFIIPNDTGLLGVHLRTQAKVLSSPPATTQVLDAVIQ